MKKIISIIVTLLCASVLFAQNEKYNSLMEEAKKFEDNKQWVHAMATYADAVVADPENCLDALTKFKELETAFRDGKPGLGKYTTRMMHDEWKKVLVEFEQYYSSHMARSVKITDIEADAYGLKYKITFTMGDSQYTAIRDAIQSGFGKAREDSWEDMPRYGSDINAGMLADFSGWPKASATPATGSVKKTILGDSCYSLVTNNAAYKANGVALIGIPMVKSIGWSDGKGPALGIFEYRNAFEDGWYDIKLKMVDNAGNTIKVSPRVFCRTSGSSDYYKVEISGLTGEQFDMIELEEATFAIDSIYLQYGYVAPSGVLSAWLSNGRCYVYDDDVNKALKAAKNPMLEISIPADTAELIMPDANYSRFKNASNAMSKKLRQIEEELEKKRREEEFRASIM